MTQQGQTGPGQTSGGPGPQLGPQLHEEEEVDAQLGDEGAPIMNEEDSDEETESEASSAGGSAASAQDLRDILAGMNERNEGVQKDLAQLLALMIKDKRREHKTETRKASDFKGTETAREARNWLQSMEFYFDNRSVQSDSEKITTTLSYCVGKAAEFARRTKEEKDKGDIKTWKQF
ncbi:unnamed protein product, partial [Peniophora sp. CBMAI 1063]